MEEKKQVQLVKVTVRNIAESPLKLRLVSDAVRGKNAQEALDILSLINKKGSITMIKAINSGIANAKVLYGVTEPESLKISKLTVDAGKTLKRTAFASRGRVSRIDKRRSHINLELTVK